jgi:hypothetical protein
MENKGKRKDFKTLTYFLRSIVLPLPRNIVYNIDSPNTNISCVIPLFTSIFPNHLMPKA